MPKSGCRMGSDWLSRVRSGACRVLRARHGALARARAVQQPGLPCLRTAPRPCTSLDATRPAAAGELLSAGAGYWNSRPAVSETSTTAALTGAAHITDAEIARAAIGDGPSRGSHAKTPSVTMSVSCGASSHWQPSVRRSPRLAARPCFPPALPTPWPERTNGSISVTPARETERPCPS